MKYKLQVLDLIINSKPDGLVTKLRNMPEIWQDIIQNTDMILPKNGSERIYAYSKEIKSKPVCQCKKELTFVSIKEGYREFCNDRKCEYARKTATERRIAKMKSNGGVGLANPKSKEKAQSTLQKIHGNDVINPGQIKSVKEKMRIDNPMFDPENVKKVAKTIESRYGAHKTNAVHINMPLKQCVLLTNEQNFSNFVKGKSITQVASESGLNYSTVWNNVKKYDLFNTMIFNHRSEMEHDLKLWLIETGITFKHDDRTVLNGMELDFLFPNNNFAIELNGLFHHSDLSGKKDRLYHKKKHDMCKNQGIQLIQVWQDEYWKSKKVIQSKILYLAGMQSIKIHARKCHVDFINNTAVEKEFLNNNHTQGFASYRQLSVAAWYNDKLVGIMSFAYQKKYWELIRYSTDINVQANGLFSKMLSFVKKSGKITGRIVSFSDNRISTGNLYYQSGWKYESELPPDYMYTDDYQTRQHKQHFRKANLIKRFSLDPTWVASHTEWEIVQELGFDRLWDAGKKRWSLTI